MSGGPTGVSTEIHPDDVFYPVSPAWYFRSGENGLHVVTQAVALSQLSNVTSILDLACGHGRVARYLRWGYPDASLYVCDLDRSGVDFCARAFAAQGIVSKPDLERVELPTVDVIWVGSLFTHLDLDHSTRWMTYLCAHLNPHGVLVATFHGQWTAEMQKTYPMIDAESWDRVLETYRKTGWGYAPYPTARTTPPSRILRVAARFLQRVFCPGHYGVALTRPGVVCDLVGGISGVRLAGYMERGWADNQDVVVVTKNDRRSPLQVETPPRA